MSEAPLAGTICDGCWDLTETEVPAVKMLAGKALCLACAGANETRFETERKSSNRFKREKYGEPITISTMTAADYKRKYGEPGKRGSQVTERTLMLWKAVSSLAIGDFIVIPANGKDPRSLRATLANSLAKMAKMQSANFRVSCAASVPHSHVVIWKLAPKSSAGGR